MRKVSLAISIVAMISTVLADVLPKKTGIHTLVLVDSWAVSETHSIFFDTLKQNGHTITYEMINPAPTIKYYEQYFFDNIILMAPSTKGKATNRLSDIFNRAKNPSWSQGLDPVPRRQPQPHDLRRH